MNSKNKEQQNRIAQIFGAKFSDTSRRMETLEFYKSYHYCPTKIRIILFTTFIC